MPLKTPDAPKHQLADEAGIPRGAVLHTTWGVEARHVTADPKVGSPRSNLKVAEHIKAGHLKRPASVRSRLLVLSDWRVEMEVDGRPMNGRRELDIEKVGQ